MLDETEVDTIPGAHREPAMPAVQKDETVEKLLALSENVKEGLRLMGVNRKQAIDLCVNCGWDEVKIMAHVNKILDTRGQA
jgi:hypothetical protein